MTEASSKHIIHLLSEGNELKSTEKTRIVSSPEISNQINDAFSCSNLERGNMHSASSCVCSARRNATSDSFSVL